uniref:Ammonium transporter n=1 Tax=Geosiphon pyriformis TaxID=50956 RepID=U3LY22_9GLOM|nr:ammonium transporter 3 [Geosiphon pyriformis]
MDSVEDTNVTLPFKNGSSPDYNPGDVGFVLMSTALVFFMVPGVGYFYSGMARSKNALSLILLSLLSIAVVSFQWWFWGFSLTYSKDSGKFIGNFRNIFLQNVQNEPSPVSQKIPDLVFALYQLMFAAITPALAIGAAAERARLFPTIIFIFVWTTLVYDVIAHWVWSPNGWAYMMGAIDFAGGTPVHISCGAAALAYCMILGKRNGHGTEEFRPHNVSNIALGTVMMWFGWFGFNGGSALSANLRAANAMYVTNLSASVGGLTWMFLDYRLERKLSTLSFCSGIIAGLVAITPGSGYVSPSAALLFGFLAGLICNLSVKLKHVFEFDDALDVFAVHGVGGILGNLLTGIFAQKSIAFYDNHERIKGGWLDHHWEQIAYQLATSMAGLFYSFAVTYIILFIMNILPGLSIRASHEAEVKGIDESEIGENAYYHVARLMAANARTGELRTIRETSNFQNNVGKIDRTERTFAHF